MPRRPHRAVRRVVPTRPRRQPAARGRGRSFPRTSGWVVSPATVAARSPSTCAGVSSRGSLAGRSPGTYASDTRHRHNAVSFQHSGASFEVDWITRAAPPAAAPSPDRAESAQLLRRRDHVPGEAVFVERRARRRHGIGVLPFLAPPVETGLQRGRAIDRRDLGAGPQLAEQPLRVLQKPRLQLPQIMGPTHRASSRGSSTRR